MKIKDIENIKKQIEKITEELQINNNIKMKDWAIICYLRGLYQFDCDFISAVASMCLEGLYEFKTALSLCYMEYYQEDIAKLIIRGFIANNLEERYNCDLENFVRYHMGEEYLDLLSKMLEEDLTC